MVSNGVPENIIHSFSLDDDLDVIIVNLEIIKLSLDFEKCVFFTKNHLLQSLKIILCDEYRDF